jgi:4-hydroxy-3-polyprenylbenzoate decarboxylase
MAYNDLREYLDVLERKGLLKWIENEVDKDWEISAIARVVSQQSPADRYALGFRRVKGYDTPVVVGIIGASRDVYATALQISGDKDSIINKWSSALANPVPSREVKTAHCQEVVLEGNEVNLHKFPIPTWSRGKDPNPYITAPCMISKDPETGIQNVGIYRMEIKGPNRTGMLWDLPSQHGAVHYKMWEKLNKPMPVCVALGADPTVLMAAGAKAMYGVDELDVAGALRGEALPVVKAKTVDLMVPANAEIVLEGEIAPHYAEWEGPFGEYTGYMGGPYELPVFEVKCITHRKNPIYQALHSQMPPSESSLLRQIPEEANIYKHLVKDLKIGGIKDIHLPESGSSYAILWISMKTMYPGHSKQVLSASWTHHAAFAKWIVVTDDDVDIRDPFTREWILSWRVEPEKDIYTISGTSSLLLDPSTAPMDVPLWDQRRLSSKVFVDATKKFEYPQMAFPPLEDLHKVREEWKRYGLDPLCQAR